MNEIVETIKVAPQIPHINVRVSERRYVEVPDFYPFDFCAKCQSELNELVAKWFGKHK